jgi:predicted TIM-barrel fold metal-dependent hydrolase
VSTLLDGVGLVDHHCHGVARDPFERRGFEAMLTEADAPGPLHGSLFDTQIGLGIRAVAAPLLDLPRFAAPDDYLARRTELGPAEVARRMLSGTGITDFLVDTGYLPDLLTSPAELAAYNGATAHEIVRLETTAESVLTASGPAGFPDAVRAELRRRAATAIAFKSIAAYRIGLDLDPERPADHEVTAAVAAWARAVDGGAPVRLVDRTVIRFLIWTAVDIGLPLQFHVGYGDSDVDLDRCDPLLLTPFLRATAARQVPVMLLHNYPFHRSAGYLAQVFDHVFVDVGLAMHNVGSRADVLLAELLELAPFGSVLFSSDACALAEIYAVSTSLFRSALGSFLEDGIARGFWPTAEADRIAVMICSGNARRAYGLDLLA